MRVRVHTQEMRRRRGERERKRTRRRNVARVRYSRAQQNVVGFASESRARLPSARYAIRLSPFFFHVIPDVFQSRTERLIPFSRRSRPGGPGRIISFSRARTNFSCPKIEFGISGFRSSPPFRFSRRESATRMPGEMRQNPYGVFRFRAEFCTCGFVPAGFQSARKTPFSYVNL